MIFKRPVEERLVFDDRTANGATELVADKVIANTSIIREPIVGSQFLNTVVFKQRPVVLVRPALKNRVSHEAAGLAVFGVEVMADHAIFLNGIG